MGSGRGTNKCKKYDTYMKKDIKILILINILCYIVYFFHGYLDMETKIRWHFYMYFSSYILVASSSFYLINLYICKNKIIEVLAEMDLFIRICALFLSFHLSLAESGFIELNVISISMIVLFILNIALEILIFKKTAYIRKHKKLIGGN